MIDDWRDALALLVSFLIGLLFIWLTADIEHPTDLLLIGLLFPLLI